MTKEPAPPFFTGAQWVYLAACFVLFAVSGGLGFNFGVFIKPLVAEFDWSRSSVSLAYSIFMIALGPFSLMAGGLSDRFGSRPIILIGIIAYAASLFLSSGIQNLWQFYLLASVLAGLGRSTFQIPLQTYIQRNFTHNRGLATGLVGSGAGLGVLLISGFSGYMIALSGWRHTYYLLGFVCLIVALPMLLLLLRPQKPLKTPGAPKRPAPEPALLPEAAYGMGAILRRRTFWSVLGSHHFDCVCHSVIVVHIVPFAIEAGVSKIRAAALMGALGLGAAFGRVFIGLIADRVGAKRALFTTLCVQTFAVPLLLLTNAYPAFVLLAALVGIGQGGHGTMYPVVTREYYGPKRVGLLFGTFSFGASLGMALGGFLGGLLHDLTGDYMLAFLFSFAVGLVSLALVRIYPSRGALPAAGEPERALLSQRSR
ncbi:MAG: MFS transporter [Nitrospinota bacterium]